MIEGEILLVDDEEDLRASVSQALELADHKVSAFAGGDAMLERVHFGFMGIAICDIRMPDMDGLTLMHRIGEIDPEIPVVLVTGHGDIRLAVRAMREGAYDFVEKPFAMAHLMAIAERAIDRRRLVLENRRLRTAMGKVADDLELRLLGRTRSVEDLRYKIRAIGPTEADVLIVGETGTGKEIVARALHDLSSRASKPFVAINCAALPPSLIESELFGHEVGAYAGAVRARYGKFELAQGGTILLDEIGSMPLDVQAKLLRVIQERNITRLGSNEPIPLDVRFIATSKADLEEQVANGSFRSDLLYRLNVVTLRVPPLSARCADIPLLFMQLVDEAAIRYRRSRVEVPPETVVAVAARNWPGNVRELRNAADRYVLGLGWLAETDSEHDDARQLTLPERVAAFERDATTNALFAYGGSLKGVYEAMGISRKTLYEKMQRYGIRRSRSED